MIRPPPGAGIRHFTQWTCSSASYSALVHPVGREVECRALASWVEEALGGTPRVVLVAGGGGIGKTQVVEAVRAALEGAGRSTALGLVPEQPGAPPFWPWRQVEAQLGGSGLFGESEGVDPEIDRFSRFEAVHAWVTERARAEGGLVLVLEDVHRADLPSLRLLAHLVLHLRNEPLAVVATHRSDAGDHAEGFPEVLDQLRRWSGTRRLELQGLDRSAVAALLDGAPPPVVDRVVEVTGGNALFVRELALHLAAGGKPNSVPGSVRDAVAVRLGRRSAPCAEALRVAAVTGRDFAAGVVATVLGQPALSVLDMMDEAADAGLIEPTGTPGRFRFVHVLVRDAVEATLGSAVLPTMHRRVAEAIEVYEGTGDDQLSDLARHWDEASVLGDRDVAAAWCERAAVAADRRLAWEESARLHDRAVEIGGPAADPLDRHRRLLGAARARLHVDTIDAVVTRCVQAAAAVEQLNQPALLAEAALVVEARGGADAALASLQALAARALAALDADEHTLRARLLGQLAHLAFYLDPARCEPLTTEALAAAELAGDPLAKVAAIRARQMVRAAPDGAEERLVLAARIGEAGQELGRASIRLWEPIWRIDSLLELGRVPEAVSALADLRRRVAEAPLPIAHWHLARVESVLAQATGRFSDALVAGARARDLFAVLESPMGAEGLFLALRQDIADQTGYDESTLDGWDLLNQVDELPQFLEDLPWFGPIQAAVGAGRLDVARPIYARLAPVASWRPPPFLEVPLLAIRMVAAIALDRSDDVAALVQRLTPFRGRHVVGSGGAVSYGGCVDRFLGKGEAALRRWDDAVANLRTALAIADAVGTPGFAAETAADLAHALIARSERGDADEAADLAERYRPVAVHLGMRPWVHRFDTIPPVAAAGALDAGSLSPRELEVASLVADGLTNKQIAAKLFLSGRTAQNHVQHILTKLGLENRTQIASWFRERTGR